MALKWYEDKPRVEPGSSVAEQADDNRSTLVRSQTGLPTLTDSQVESAKRIMRECGFFSADEVRAIMRRVATDRLLGNL